MSEDAPERRREYTWNDPAAMAELVGKRSGLELLQAIVAGTLPKPPIADTLNYELTEVREGLVVFEIVPAEYHYNPLGVVHGGLAATLLDSAMGCAVHSALPAGTRYTTLELKVNYIRAMTTATGRVRAEGKVINIGGRVGVAEGRIVDDEGKLYAHATTTCIIFR
jgi:uncharacterized protein (TIGR00369 family)